MALSINVLTHSEMVQKSEADLAFVFLVYILTCYMRWTKIFTYNFSFLKVLDHSVCSLFLEEGVKPESQDFEGILVFFSLSITYQRINFFTCLYKRNII